MARSIGVFIVSNFQKNIFCVAVEKDILYYALNMGRFRKMLAETLGLEPTIESTGQEDRVMCLGQLEVFPGEKYPVYWVTWYDWDEYKCAISKLLLGSKTPFIILSGLPRWPDDFLPYCKERNVATFSIGEALEFRGNRFQPTEGWHQTIEVFRKTLKPDNMVAAPPFEFRKKGQGWVVRYDGKETFLKDGIGPCYMSMLLKKPNKEIFAMTLHAIVAGQTPDKVARVGVTDLVMDEQTQKEIEDRLRELVADIAEAQKSGDHFVEQESQEEYDELLAFYQKNIGLGGQVRKEHDTSAKIRQAVLKAIHLAAIAVNASFLMHYDAMIKRGVLPQSLDDLPKYQAASQGTDD